MKQLFTYIIIVATLGSISGQEFPHKDYTYDDTAIDIPTKYKDAEELVLFKKRRVDILTKKKTVKQFFLHHSKILVKSDEAIERNNRIYISVENEGELLINKNRVIQPDGSVVELDKKDIHEEVDEESGDSYKYYAVKGLQKGSIIERIYAVEEAPHLSGSRYRFDQSVPIVNATLSVTYPSHLVMSYKSYNGLSEARLDTLSEKQHRLTVEMNDIEPSKSEKYSNGTKKRKIFRYKLQSNTITGERNFYNYKDFGNKFYQGITLPLMPKEKKALKKYLKGLDMDDNLSTLRKVQLIEDHIKKTIVFQNGYSYSGDVKEMLKRKRASLVELCRLYTLLLKQYDIESQIIFTNNRWNRYFDTDFETTDNLEEVLIFIPSIDVYIDMKDVTTRSPLIAHGYGHNKGVILKGMRFGEMTLGITDTVYVPLPGLDITTDTMFINVDFNKGVDEGKVRSKMVYGGYSAAYYQPIVDFVDQNQYEEVLDEISRNYTGDVKPSNIDTQNGGVLNLGHKNFVLDIEFEATDLVEYAGDKILFPIGKLIGKQSELYQEEDRESDVEINFPHAYTRYLNVTLPSGYKVANMDDFTIEKELLLDEDKAAVFYSKGTLVDNEFRIENTEYYKAMEYPLSRFDEYKAVINAAADFNKLVLVLEKE